MRDMALVGTKTPGFSDQITLALTNCSSCRLPLLGTVALARIDCLVEFTLGEIKLIFPVTSVFPWLSTIATGKPSFNLLACWIGIAILIFKLSF